ncbi:hypothetical protein HDU98_008904 [Podochytrium sp. JEL0797]|nr:hypothetical protein HDU98_008904 [Podochytrium sp. JEL0797]
MTLLARTRLSALRPGCTARLRSFASPASSAAAFGPAHHAVQADIAALRIGLKDIYRGAFEPQQQQTQQQQGEWLSSLRSTFFASSEKDSFDQHNEGLFQTMEVKEERWQRRANAWAAEPIQRINAHIRVLNAHAASHDQLMECLDLKQELDRAVLDQLLEADDDCAGEAYSLEQLGMFNQLPPLPSAAEDPKARPKEATNPTKKVVMVAKKMAPDYLGEGPKKQKDGKLIEYTLLGDAQDFAEMDQELGESSVLEEDEASAVAVEPEVLEQQQIQQREIERVERERLDRLREVQERQAKERKRWLNRLYIFQKYRELREEHALRNWKRHSIQWNKVQRSIAKKSNKDRSELLMSRLGEHRERVEERDLIVEAFQLLEDRKVNFWSKGLRIGNDLLGLIVTAPKGGCRRIERLVTNEERHYISSANSYREQRKQELNHVIEKLDPFFNDGVGGFMEVVGKSLDSAQIDLAESFASKLDARAAAATRTKETTAPKQSDSSTLPKLDNKNPTPATTTPLHTLPPLETDTTTDLVFASTHMTFEVVLNEVSRSVLSVYNQSTKAFHFEWRRVHKDNPLRVKAMHDGVQRFYFHHKTGVVLPGTAFDFPIVFKSGSPGIFTEIWELVTNPSVAANVATTVTFQGFAMEEDTNKAKRNSIEELLERRRMTSTASEVISDILEKVTSTSAAVPTALEKHKLLLTNDEHLFTVLNADLHISYFPKLFDRFETLANETLVALARPASLWDRSVRTIYENISCLDSMEDRSQRLHKLNELVKLSTATTFKSSFSPLYVVAYDTLVDLADKISECSESLRKHMGLPLQRSAAQFERAEEEEDQNADRKPTPAPVVEAKKGAAPAKDAKGKAAPPPAKGAAAAAPAKGGAKKGEAPPAADDSANRPQLAKITRRQPKPDSSRTWPPHRRLLESQYTHLFHTQTTDLVSTSLTRILHLFTDVSSSTTTTGTSRTEIQAAVQVAQGVSASLVAAKRVRDQAAEEEVIAGLKVKEEEARRALERVQMQQQLQMKLAVPVVAKEAAVVAAAAAVAVVTPVAAVVEKGKGGKAEVKRKASPGKERSK